MSMINSKAAFYLNILNLFLLLVGAYYCIQYRYFLYLYQLPLIGFFLILAIQGNLSGKVVHFRGRFTDSNSSSRSINLFVFILFGAIFTYLYIVDRPYNFNQEFYWLFVFWWIFLALVLLAGLLDKKSKDEFDNYAVDPKFCEFCSSIASGRNRYQECNVCGASMCNKCSDAILCPNCHESMLGETKGKYKYMLLLPKIFYIGFSSIMLIGLFGYSFAKRDVSLDADSFQFLLMWGLIIFIIIFMGLILRILLIIYAKKKIG